MLGSRQGRCSKMIEDPCFVSLLIKKIDNDLEPIPARFEWQSGEISRSCVVFLDSIAIEPQQLQQARQE